MKVFVIGPIYPFRGGIAHSNLGLCTNLSKNHDVTVLSFKRMFPKFLYPGKDQYEPSIEDRKFQFKREFLIDTINPINWINILRYIKKEKPDRLIFQWWHPFFAPCYSVMSFISKKLLKIKVGVIGQVIVPHETGLVNKANILFSKIFFVNVDYFIVLSSGDSQELKKIMPKAKVNMIIEPTYEDIFCSGKITKKGARKKIGLASEDKVLLFFGFVRPYKGLAYLLDAISLVLKRISVKLIIAGEFWSNKDKYLRQIEKLGLRKNILIFDKYIPNEDVEIYFKAADVVVLPYVSAAESGIIQTALGFNVPAIATDVGGNKDLIKNGINGYISKPKNEKDLAEKIVLFFENGIKSNQFQKKQTEWDLNKENKILGL